MKKTLITIAITAILTASIVTARTIHNQYVTGVAWNWGGVDILPVPALFICPGNLDFDGTFTPNPIAPFFPELITDC